MNKDRFEQNLAHPGSAEEFVNCMTAGVTQWATRRRHRAEAAVLVRGIVLGIVFSQVLTACAPATRMEAISSADRYRYLSVASSIDQVLVHSEEI